MADAGCRVQPHIASHQLQLWPAAVHSRVDQQEEEQRQPLACLPVAVSPCAAAIAAGADTAPPPCARCVLCAPLLWLPPSLSTLHTVCVRSWSSPTWTSNWSTTTWAYPAGMPPTTRRGAQPRHGLQQQPAVFTAQACAGLSEEGLLLPCSLLSGWLPCPADHH